jgi:hypothetical protein
MVVCGSNSSNSSNNSINTSENMSPRHEDMTASSINTSSTTTNSNSSSMSVATASLSSLQPLKEDVEKEFLRSQNTILTAEIEKYRQQNVQNQNHIDSTSTSTTSSEYLIDELQRLRHELEELKRKESNKRLGTSSQHKEKEEQVQIEEEDTTIREKEQKIMEPADETHQISSCTMVQTFPVQPPERIEFQFQSLAYFKLIALPSLSSCESSLTASKEQVQVKPKMKLIVKKALKLSCGSYMILTAFRRFEKNGQENLRVDLYDSEKMETYRFDLTEDQLHKLVVNWSGSDDVQVKQFISMLIFTRDESSGGISMCVKVSTDVSFSSPPPSASASAGIPTTTILKQEEYEEYDKEINMPAVEPNNPTTETPAVTTSPSV